MKRAASIKMSAEARHLRHQEIERLRKQEEEDSTDDSSVVRVSAYCFIFINCETLPLIRLLYGCD